MMRGRTMAGDSSKKDSSGFTLKEGIILTCIGLATLAVIYLITAILFFGLSVSTPWGPIVRITESSTTEPETTIEPETATPQIAAAKPYIDPDHVVISYYHATIEDYRAVLIDDGYKTQLTLSKENFNPNKPEGGTMVKQSSINSYVLMLQGADKKDLGLEYLEPAPTIGTYISGTKNGPTLMYFYDPSVYLIKPDGTTSWRMVTGFDKDPENNWKFIPGVYKITIPQGDNPPEIRYIKLIPY
jgi:hypothetical protein